MFDAPGNEKSIVHIDFPGNGTNSGVPIAVTNAHRDKAGINLFALFA